MCAIQILYANLLMQLNMQHNSNQSNRIIIDCWIRGNVREIKERKLLIATKEKTIAVKKKLKYQQKICLCVCVCVPV